MNKTKFEIVNCKTDSSVRLLVNPSYDPDVALTLEQLQERWISEFDKFYPENRNVLVIVPRRVANWFMRENQTNLFDYMSNGLEKIGYHGIFVPRGVAYLGWSADKNIDGETLFTKVNFIDFNIRLKFFEYYLGPVGNIVMLITTEAVDELLKAKIYLNRHKLNTSSKLKSTKSIISNTKTKK